MLSKQTVFVLGAGSSYELGIPCGDGLMTEIEGVLSIAEDAWGKKINDLSIWQAVEQLTARKGQLTRNSIDKKFVAAAEAIRRALTFAQSIDNYLDGQRDEPEIVAVGKVAITRAILNKERFCHITARVGNNDNDNDVVFKMQDPAKNSWHVRLMRLLTAGKTRAQLPTILENVSFIVFNYDRCLEYFLYHALQAYYGATHEEVVVALKSLRVIHPYGQVGWLPWEESSMSVPFGSLAKYNLLEISEGIQTFTETVNSSVARSVHEALENADTIVFMGFGFLPQNVELLTVDQPALARRVFLTTKGFSDTDYPLIVESDLVDMLKRPNGKDVVINRHETFEAFVERGTCANLMDNNWRRLTTDR